MDYGAAAAAAAAELMKQIAALDIQILELESRLLSLYRSHDRRSRSSPSHSSHRTLAHHLGNDPAQLSQHILGCVCSIYSRFANKDCSASASASTSPSLSASGSWSSDQDRGATLQVTSISLDRRTFKYAATMLQKLSSLVAGLEHVDPARMKRDDKLAFWLNIHNALLMHGYLAYGTHSSSVFKAAYNVGGHCINAHIIQTSILGIRSHYSPPWIQTLLSPKKKTTRHIYCLEYPEPLVHFALSSGSSSDPPVQVYTPATVFQDLKLARDDFIRATLHIHKESKLCLPKLVSHFGREMSMSISELLEMVCSCAAEAQRKAVRSCIKGREDKCVTWIPMSSNFQFLIHSQDYMFDSYIQS